MAYDPTGIDGAAEVSDVGDGHSLFYGLTGLDFSRYVLTKRGFAG